MGAMKAHSLSVPRCGQRKPGGHRKSIARRDCDLAELSLLDTDPLPAGEVAFYLVTGSASGLESALGRSSAGAERANASPCP